MPRNAHLARASIAASSISAANAPGDAEGGSPALRLIALLEHVARADKPLTLTDIVLRVQQPKPTVYRMLQQLESAGLLAREPDGKRYAPGPRLSRLAENVLLSAQSRAPRHAILEKLVADVGETCNFTMPSGTEVVYVDRVETAWPLRFHLQPGSRVPMHCSASGKLFLAWMPQAQRSRLLAHLGFERYTSNTITTRSAFEAELARVRSRGYALDNEEFFAGLVCVAVPVFDAGARSRVRGSIAIQAPASRFPIDRAESALPALKQAASDMSAAISVFGDSPPAPVTAKRAKTRAAPDKAVHSPASRPRAATVAARAPGNRKAMAT